jgi:natural product biosynthesis luciferase-like monooxygenase protein/amino acid adenylation domain-containing protein
MNSSTLVELLQSGAQKHPDRASYIFLADGELEEASISYRELDRQARSIASSLQSQRLTGERVLLLYPPGLEYISAFFGCIYAGVIAVPLASAGIGRSERWLSTFRSIIHNSEPLVCLTTADYRIRLEKLFGSARDLKSIKYLTVEELNAHSARKWRRRVLSGQTVAYLQYTSGSTSDPKGVMITHDNVLHNLEDISRYIWHPDSVLVSWLPHYHDMGLISSIFIPLFWEAPSYLMPPASFIQQPSRWLRAVSRYRATHITAPNFAYDLSVAKFNSEACPGLDLSSCHVATCGAEPIRYATINRFGETFAPYGFRREAFCPAYGMAEATLMVSQTHKLEPTVVCRVLAHELESNRVVDADDDRDGGREIVGCGHKAASVELAVVNPESRMRCAPDEIGEIWVTGPSIGLGYWNRPDETEAIFKARIVETNDGPFMRTGDLGFIRDGELYITGRRKDLIILHGRNHYPQDLELTAEQSHTALTPGGGAAFTVEFEGEERLVVVHEIGRRFYKSDPTDIFAAIRANLAEHHQVQVQTVVLIKSSSIPKTSSGKIQRRLCREKFLAGSLEVVAEDRPESGAVKPAQSEPRSARRGVEFSLFYFSSNEAEFTDDKYRLFIEGAKLADQRGFTAVWTPERHFHAFGGLFPNPSVLCSALAMVTERIRLRAGSVVLPLHHPIRVAEEWSVVDNLSRGRVDLAFARGWNPNDFALGPENYRNSAEELFSRLETVRRLWRGETITVPNGAGENTEINIYPLPSQPELPVWITCSGGRERFVEAGACGANVLTALLFQSIEELQEKLDAYRDSRAKHGYDPATGKVTLMLHTFVADELGFVRDKVRGPFIEYLKSSVKLWSNGSKSLQDLSEEERGKLLDYAFERYFQMSALFGTPHSCLDKVHRLKEIGVDEIACLIDFGVDVDSVLASLHSLDTLRRLSQGSVTEETQPAAERQRGLEDLRPAPEIDPPTSHPPRSTTLKAKEAIKLATDEAEDEELLEWIRHHLLERISASLRINRDQIPLDKSFNSLGIDSIKAVELMDALGRDFEVAISPTVLFEVPTVVELARYLVQHCGSDIRQHLRGRSVPRLPLPVEAATLQAAGFAAVSDGRLRCSNGSDVRPGDIAVIGLACRFPHAANPKAFWELLRNGRDAIEEVPPDHWDWRSYYDENPEAGNKTYSRWGGFLEGIDRFDSAFFHISPREARLIDPQQRLFLEVSWEALESAGYAAESLAQKNVGVFVGCSNNTYYQRIAPALTSADHSAGIGNQNAIIANRVSFFLNLRGPSVLIDTLCSSSLVAIHQACQSLRLGECTMALAGGVNLLLSPEYFVAMSRMKAHSPDGRCKAFDHRANGIAFGEGAGVVLLKPLSRALEDHDHIYSVIKGSAINHGGQANGLTAPNPRAQADLIAHALEAAGVSAESISYVEAHGTGTSLGDPIEIEGLTQAFRRYTDRNQFCAIGSVKTNIGHLEPAAGISGLVKVILSMQHRQLPPSLHFERPNPIIPFVESPFKVNTELREWISEGPRRAGVSSFGMGGANAHLVLEEAPPLRPEVSEIERPLHLITLSARTESALGSLAGDYVDFLADRHQISIADIGFTANTGRARFAHRLAVVADSPAGLREQLSAFAAGGKAPHLFKGQVMGEQRRKIAFLFTGQGSQYIDMGRRLYQTQPTFRRVIEQCDEILRSYLDQPLLSMLYPADGAASPLLDQTVYTQPALFALEYALSELWRSWGVTPDLVIGHSVGEYVAACVARVFTLEEGLRLIAERGRLMQPSIPAGAPAESPARIQGEMVAIFADEERVAAALAPFADRVSIAAVNGPRNIVISGERQAVRKVVQLLETDGIATQELKVSQAFHSPLMNPILGRFERLASQISFRTPRIPLISNLTGQRLGAGEVPNAGYWSRHLRETVRFGAGIKAAAEQGAEIMLELGPHPSLIGMGKRCLPDLDIIWLPSLKQGQDDWHVLLGSLGELFVQGIKVDWSGFDRDYRRRRISLPTYPFERSSHWIQPSEQAVGLQIKESSNGANHQIRQSIPTQEESGPALGKIIPLIGTRTTGAKNLTRRERILWTLRDMTARLLQTDLDQVDINASFLELGADSLVLINAIRDIQDSFGIKVSVRRFFEDLSNIGRLAGHIDEQLPPDAILKGLADDLPDSDSANHEPPLSLTPSHQPDLSNGVGRNLEPPALSQVKSAVAEMGHLRSNGTGAVSSVEQIISQQIETISQLSLIMSRQLEILAHHPLTSASQPSANGIVTEPVRAVAAAGLPQPAKIQPQPGATNAASGQLSPGVKSYLEEFITRYTRRTQKSKQHAQQYRRRHAGRTGGVGMRPNLKEIYYPLIARRSEGSKIWDIDGNRYIDVAMGFGVYLFGHAAPFIKEALEGQLEQGIQIGAESVLAGEVAELITELTGTERVAFSNSGTEAVMTALRLARTATGRTKIALFEGSYHGHSDWSLVRRAQTPEGGVRMAPLVPGVPQVIADEIIVLDYADRRSLETIRAYAHELAAVLVEPVQSRRPDLQPGAFLQELRTLTEQHGITLIFDEMITGFRIHLGGAQAHFGIKADLVTYGKIVGGGMPLGVIAGKSRYMDAIDGGMWNYGDDSYPEAETTFFTGTFCKHPLAMASARAVLRHLKEKGPDLQHQLNRRTSQMAESLNLFFKNEGAPLYIEHFSSLFTFKPSTAHKTAAAALVMDLWRSHLIERNIYQWEGPTCFLSTAHTDEDIDCLIGAVKDAIKAMQRGGLIGDSSVLPPGSGKRRAAEATKPPALDTLPPIEPVPRDQYLPLSFAQQRLWFLHQLHPDSAVYNVFVGFRLTGALNIAAVEQSINEIIARHEILRTIFPSIDGQPRQVIIPRVALSITLVDLSGCDEPTSQAKIPELAGEMSSQPFDLTHGPLLRVVLLKLGEQEHIALLTVHHIISDGWSMGIVFNELAAVYESFIGGGTSRLAPMAIGYADFAHWQRTWLTEEALSDQLAYWKRHLAMATPQLDLPTDRPRPAVASHRGGTVRFALSRQLCESLKALSKRKGVTLYMAILSAFKSLLYRYTNQTDLIVGCPVNNRNQADVEGLIGFFINTLALRTHLSGNTTFNELLGRVRESALGGYTNQDLPFERLVEELRPQRDADRQPLFQVVFMLEKAQEEVDIAGLKLSQMWFDARTAKFDLTMSVEESPNELVCLLEYSSDLFDSSTIKRMANHFQTLLESIVAHPERRLAELQILTDDEEHQVIHKWNAAPVEPGPGRCVHELFEDQAAGTPEAVAIVCGGEQLTYSELNCRANRLAHYLRRLGVGPEITVAVYMERSLEMIVALLGVMKAGGAYLPLDPEYPKSRLMFMLADSGSRVLLTQERLRESLPPGAAHILCVDSAWQSISRESEALPAKSAWDATENNLCYIIYTSGSTGDPKGVMINHGNVVRLFKATERSFGFNRNDVWTLLHSYAFDFSVWEYLGALLYGGRLVIVPYWQSRSSRAFYQLLNSENVTVLNQTPSFFRHVIDEDRVQDGPGCRSLRVVIFGGEALDFNSLRPWIERYGDRRPELVNMYGITETTVHVTYRPVKRADWETGVSSIGAPLEDLQVYVLDEEMNPVPIGIKGEMYVGGAGVARQYLGQRELTGERFVPDPFSRDAGRRLYRSGDLARRRDNGELEYCGRKDQQVKVRGFRIELEEIKSALMRHSAVRDAAVMAREDEPGDKRLVAYMVAGDRTEITSRELRAYLQERLPEYMVPAAFVWLERLPLTANGKIDRRALPKPEQTGTEREYESPGSAVEEILAGIFADVLKVEQVGREESFFELGGHSLMATQVISRVNAVFELDLPLKTVFESPTVEGVAEQVERALGERRKPRTSEIRRAERTGRLPLSYAQQRLWFLDQLDPGNAAYNMTGAVRLAGPLDVMALQRSLSEIVRRHEVLRTSFVSEDGEPRQVISEKWELDLPVKNLYYLPEEERMKSARSIAGQEAQRGFDLSRGPLLRAELLRVGAQEHLLVVNMHHIVSDGWSIDVLLRELAALYEAYSRGGESPLEELELQYADFAVWQREWLQGDVLEEQLRYWREQLYGLETLNLPTDCSRPAVASFRGSTVPISISAEVASRLAELSRQEGVTIFMTLLAALKVLLNQYTGQEDLAVGTNIANRNRAELEGIIGFFVNNLVLRTDLSGDPTFRELLSRVRRVSLNAYAYQDLPFEKLVEALQSERDLSQTPLFQIALVWQDLSAAPWESAGLSFEIMEIDSRVSKFDLTFFIGETDQGLTGSIEYNLDLFDAATIEEMRDRFQTLLAAVADAPGSPISSYSRALQGQHNELISDFIQSLDAL